jgi:hypothetical protein
MLGIAVLGMLFTSDNVGAKVVYTMVIAVNLMIILLGKVPVKYLMKKTTSK